MTDVSLALQTIKKPNSDTQTVLQLVQTLKNTDQNVAQLLTLSPSCTEIFVWWEGATGGHPSQSGACFNIFITIIRSVLKSNQSFCTQAVAISRKVLKERLHSVYGALSKYAATNVQRSCLELLGLMNLLDSSLTRILLDDFNFAHPSLKDMLSKNGSLHLDAIRFLLSFLCSSSSESKVKFMSINNIIKTMLQKIENDNDQIKCEVVDILSEHILSDPKIPKKIKSKFFSTGSLLKISQFLESSNEKLREKTNLLFAQLCTDMKYGILYPPSSVFIESSTNPTLVQLIRQAKLVPLSKLVSTLANVSPDLFPVALENLVLLSRNKQNTMEALGAMIKLYQSKDNKVLLKFITLDITDLQIAKFIAPKLVTDLVEVSLKSIQADIVIQARSLLRSLVKDVASIVTLYPSRVNLPEIVLFHLPDCSVDHLSPLLAGCYLKIDRYCLVRSSVQISSFCPSSSLLMSQDVELLMLLPRNDVFEFVRDNYSMISESFAKLTLRKEVAGELLMRCFLESTGVFVGTEVDYICNVIFHIRDDSPPAGLTEMLHEELQKFLIIIFDIIFKDFEILSSEVSKFYQGIAKYCNVCPTSCKLVLVQYLIFDGIKYEFGDPTFEEKILHLSSVNYLPQASPNFLAKYFQRDFSVGEGIRLLICDTNTERISSRLVRMFTFDKELKEPLPASLLRQILDCVAQTDLIKSENFQTVFRTIVSILISKKYLFNASEIITALILDVEDDLLAAMMSDVHTKMTMQSKEIDIKRAHDRATIHKLYEIFPDVCFINRLSKYVKTHNCDTENSMTLRDNDYFNPEFLTLYCLFTSNKIACKSILKMHSFFNKMKIFDYVSLEMLEVCFNEMIRNPEEFDCYADVLVYIHSILQMHNPGKVYHTEFHIVEMVSDPHLKRKVLAIVCSSVNNVSTAHKACITALELGFFEVFYETQFEHVLELYGGMKTKKCLKEVLSNLTERSETQHITNFISKHYKVYEETVPLFTIKTIKKLISKTIKSPSSASLDILKDFILIFQSLLSETLLCDIFSSLLQIPNLMKHLTITDDESDVKSSFISLFSAMTDIVHIPQTFLTTQCYVMFQAAYTATSSETDNKVLKILKYFETKDVISKFPFAYSTHVPTASLCKNIDAYNEQCINIIESLDPVKLQSLIDNFPLHSLDSGKVSSYHNQYSSEFLLSMICYILHHGGLDVKSFLSSPIVQIPLLAISSYDETTRFIGYCCLEKFFYMTEEDNFREKSFCNLILLMLKRSVTERNQRVPHLITYFIGKFILAMFKPQMQCYEAICHFLLQRPVFDFFDVPMFYNMFCSSAQFYAENQNWFLKILIPAVKDDVDFSILARRHVLPLCISQLPCGICDKMTGKLIKQLFVKVNSVTSAKVRKDLNEICIISHLMK